MIDNAYRTLGVSPSATDDEIKTAYRKLAKRYHPDANPGEEAAAKKMAEINAAYDEIIAFRQGKTQADPFSGFSGGGSRGEYTAVRNFIMNRHFLDAMNVLSRMETRDAEWYFLAGYAQYGLGNRAQALEYAGRAVQMDPNNAEYRGLLNALRSGGRVYADNTRGYTMPQTDGGWCCRMIALNLFFNLCCGC